jgi:hypothetical protein
MKLHPVALLVCAVIVAGTSLVHAQSLGELARQEAARRQTVAKGKVITNSDLKPVPPPSPGAVPPATAGTALPPPPEPDQADAANAGDATAATKPAAATDGKTDEKYWRGRMAEARDNLARSQTFQDALQARIAALSTDFVNRDDPAQRAQIANERQKALAELDRVKKDIVTYQTQLTTIAEEGRRAGVPAAWVR